MTVKVSCPYCDEEEEFEDSSSIQWYCPNCGGRRDPETDPETPEDTKTDKI